MLIILVVFDHNEYAHKLFPLFLEGFSFHVIGFFALPFLRRAEPMEKKVLEKMFFSYYYPFLWIVCGMAVVNALIIKSISFSNISNLILALYSANSQILKNVTQMSLLWFLPSFFALMLFRSLLMAKRKSIQLGIFIALLVAHFFIGSSQAEIRNYLPLGSLPVIYAIPLIVCVVTLHQIIFEKLNRTVALSATSILFFLVKYIQIQMGLSQELGFALVADYRDISAVLVNDLEAVVGTLMIFQLARFNFSVLVEKCGKNSMQIYLFHAFVALGVYKSLEKFFPMTEMNLRFIISISITLVITSQLAKIVMQSGFTKRFLFPRSWNELFRKNSVLR